MIDAGSTRTGTPVSRAIPASRSRSSGALDISRFTFAPPAAGAPVAPAVRDGDHPGDDVLGDHGRQFDLAVRRGDAHDIAVDDVGRRRVVDVHTHMLGTLAAHEQRRVVHPRVLRARLPHRPPPVVSTGP